MPKRLGKNNKELPHARVNYEDHSLKFLDWVDRLGIERSWFGRLLITLEERLQIKRFLGLFLFCVILAYAVTFEFAAPLDFRVGEIAKHGVISPMSFEMVDQSTTEEKRIKAEQAVPVIFDYDNAIFERVSGAVYRSFRIMRSYLKSEPIPRSSLVREERIKEFFIHKGEFEKELGESVPDYLFEWLVQNGFSARLENVMIRNLDSWYQQKISDNLEKTIAPNQSVVLARTVNKNNRGKEFPIHKSEIIEANNAEAFNLKNLKGIEKAAKKDLENVTALTRLLIYPNLTLNKQEVANRKQAARDAVLPITVSVKKNQEIISEGIVVQPFHMAMVHEIENLRSSRRHDILAMTLALLFLVIIMVFYQYLRRFASSKMKVESKDIFVMGFITLFTVVFAKFFLFTTETAFISRYGALIPTTMFLYATPVASASLLVGLLIPAGEIVWLFTAFISLVMGLMTEMNLAFMVVTFASGISAARGVYNCKKRSDIYRAGLKAGMISAALVALLLAVERMDHETLVRDLLFSVPAGFIGGVFSSLIAMMAIPLLESVFNYTTDVKLLELSNLNHPLLKEMIVKAPGTYHHSMLVGSMVEAAAEEIGANPLLGKVMCYYHDIGKTEHANYFIENQKPGNNPHDHISPYMSKTLLVAHVKDGVELGMAHKLGKPIIDGVIQHHGTTLISYFYNKALDIKAEGEAEVSEEEFRYPGPKPQFREAALCMLADSIEAASRSLDEPTPVRLQNIVRNIVQRKFMEGQLDECSLTLKDLSKVEMAFTRILLGIYHQRIDYPKGAGGGASESPSQPFFVVKN